MLSKDYRLRKTQEIKKALQKGRAFYGRSLGIKILANQEKNNRFCSVVSNKISKKAVKRNKIRRRIREIVRLNRDNFKGNYDIIVLVKPQKEVLERTYQELNDEVSFVFKKSGVDEVNKVNRVNKVNTNIINSINFISSMLKLPRKMLVLFIRLYQLTLSPDHSWLGKKIAPNGFCRYHPSCSEYGKQAISKHGIILGAPRALWRIMRCNPWSKGGLDPVK